MSIQTYKNKAGKTRYRVEVTVGYGLDGKADRRTKTCATKREAEKAEFELLVMREGLHGRSDKMTFGEFVEAYYLPMKRKALRKTTMRGYESVLNNHLLPVFAHTPLTTINRMQIQNLLSGKATYKVAKNTRDVLRQVLGEAVQMEAIPSNPAAGRYRLPDKKETDRNCSGEWVSSPTEQRRIIALATKDLHPVLVLGFCFGLRKGEILGLDWSDIDFKERTISIRRTYTHTKGDPELTAPKTAQSVRRIPMSSYAYQQLRAIQGDMARIGPVCVHEGTRLTPHAAQKLMRHFVLANDIPNITCHSLRHSFATASVRSGAAVEHISKWLGHTSITTTYNRYVKPLQDDLFDVVAILDRAYEAGI